MRILRNVAIVALFMASSSVAQSMDKIACTIEPSAGASDSALGERLCAQVADTIGARPTSMAEMKAILRAEKSDDETIRLHMLTGSIVSDRSIAFRYAYGSPEDWRANRETAHDDLHIDVMDKILDETAALQIADTIQRLSAQ